MEQQNPSELLKTTDLFKELEPEEAAFMKDRIFLRKYKRGEYIFRPKDEALVMYIVKSGAMKITKDLSDGREQILYIYHKEDFVGGLNLLTSEYYHYNGIALTDTSVILVQKEDFHRVLLNNRGVLRSLLKESFARIRKSEELIDRLSVINGDMKVAKTLINLLKTNGNKDESGLWVIDSPLNRQEIGSFTGLTRETLTRKLTHFQELGIIELMDRGKIRIIDMESLTNLTI